MTRRLTTGLALAAGLCLLAAQTLAAHHLNGTWKLDVVLGDAQGGTATVTLAERAGGKLEGTYTGAVGSDLAVTGTVDAAHVVFGFDSPVGRVTFDGTYAEGRLSGTADYGMGGKGTFSGGKSP
ncbi:MAG: hypothetical protein AB7I04_06155 [Pseudomonadales bacterium]